MELIFKWVKQNLRIKSSFGTSENTVKSQIWMAIAAYLLAAIMKKRLNIEENLHTVFQILSLTLFEKTLFLQMVTDPGSTTEGSEAVNQSNLFN